MLEREYGIYIDSSTDEEEEEEESYWKEFKTDSRGLEDEHKSGKGRRDVERDRIRDERRKKNTLRGKHTRK